MRSSEVPLYLYRLLGDLVPYGFYVVTDSLESGPQCLNCLIDLLGGGRGGVG